MGSFGKFVFCGIPGPMFGSAERFVLPLPSSCSLSALLLKLFITWVSRVTEAKRRAHAFKYSAAVPAASFGGVSPPADCHAIIVIAKTDFWIEGRSFAPRTLSPTSPPDPLPRFAAERETDGCGWSERFTRCRGSRLSRSFRKSILAIAINKLFSNYFSVARSKWQRCCLGNRPQ